MKQKAIKLILSGAASLALAVSLTATTFAYVLIGNTATVDEFDFKVEGQEGLMISLDGTNFSQDITGTELKKKLANSVEAFDNNYITGTTIKNSGNTIIADGDISFVKEKINRATHERTYVDANENEDYLKFDLYFKVLNTKTAATNYEVVFGENTYINAIEDVVKIQHGFATWKYDSVYDYYAPTPYQANQEINQNVANAMRIGVYNSEVVSDPLQVYEVYDNSDLGSAAITGRIDERHDPYSSVMINYYNVYHPFEAFTTTNTTKRDYNGNLLDGVYGAEDGYAFNTINEYGHKDANDKWIGKKVVSFGNEDVVKVTMLIWLEGWDADYLLGTSIQGSTFACSLEFVLTEV